MKNDLSAVARTVVAGIVLISTAAAVGQQSEVSSEDVSIGHVSTVPANRGERVNLVARHYRSEDTGNGAVVVLSSDYLPAAAGLGLDAEGYDHLEHLAGLGFEVFAADVTGYGLSPKPMMDDGCNATDDVQNALLMPYPLYIPCDPSYQRRITSLFTDWDEVDTIIQYVRESTGFEQVSLIGWGAGAARAGGYAAMQPAAIERLVLVAPEYDPAADAQAPDQYPTGAPLEVHEVGALVDDWREAAQCEDLADFEMVSDQLTSQMIDLDPTAAEWGYEPGGLVRSPGRIGNAGFNSQLVTGLDVPTMVISGLDDPQHADAVALYEDLGSDEKVLMQVECGTRWLIWENARSHVREAVAQFLQSGAVDGAESGVLELSRDGQLSTVEP